MPFSALTLLPGHQKQHVACKILSDEVLSAARCRRFANGPADATATPIISCFIKIQNAFTFLVLSYPGCPGKEAIKWVSVCLRNVNT